ncbi:hypothetical protein [Pedobacter borealis]|uniref:hypothetical protein n=1 Tax=Pedobacter borealis TaxID=475254 RepID=UPI0004934EE2|nr:hypothetical protein [Pedobacter borealis]
MKKNIKFLLVIFTVALSACKKKDGSAEPIMAAPTTTKEYSFDTDANSGLMFQDNEPMATFTAEDRRYEIGKVLRVKAVNESTIEIANFAPVDIEDATILISIQGMASPVKLIRVKKIRAHAIQQIKYPFIEGTKKFFDTNNNEVDLSKYQTDGIAPSQVSFDFTGETELIKKLKKLAKLKWTIKYHDFDTNDDPKDNWKENPTAKDIRRFSGFIIDLAYSLQEDVTHTAFVNEPIIDNDGVTFMTTAQKEAVYQKIMDIPKFNCGVVSTVNGVQGLGGGSTFGMEEAFVLNNFMKYNVAGMAMHEIGHMVGYSHSSSMTYEINGHGATIPMGPIYRDLIAKNELPIRPTNYYRLSDFP